MKKQKTKKHNFRLPNKPSALIRVALEDLAWAENNPNYEIDMGHWHSPFRQGKICYVCLAGSTVAHRSGYTNRKFVIPSLFSTKLKDKLQALNKFRTGHISEGLVRLKINPSHYYRLPVWMPVEAYAGSSEKFKNDLLAVACRLEEVGL